MIKRDQLGVTCKEHGRIALGGGASVERAAANHLRTLHPHLWVSLCNAERVPAGEN